MINPNGQAIEYAALGKLIELATKISEDKRKWKIRQWLGQAAKIRYYLKALDNKKYLTDIQINKIYQCLLLVADLNQYPTGLAIAERQAPAIAVGLQGPQGEQGPPGDPASLPNGQIFIGNASNVATPQTVSGDISLTNTGIASIGAGVIIDNDISNIAAISVSKLAALTPSRIVVTNGSGLLTVGTPTATEVGYLSGVTSAIQTQIDSKIGAPTGAISAIVSSNLTVNRALSSDGAGKIIASTVTATEQGYLSGVTSAIQTQLNSKQATITGGASTITSSNLTINRALISDGSGKVAVHGTTTNTEIGYLTGVTSAIQTQINSKLGVALTSPANGDIIYYNGSNWVNLPRGTNGQALYSTAGSIQWNTPTINGIPIGGTLNQVLTKNSGTDFDTSWQTLTVGHIPSITATATELNILTGATLSTVQLNYSTGVTGPIQTQLDSKLSATLPLNNIFVGNGSNLAVPLGPGTNGYVLTSVSGVPTWQPVSVGTPPGSNTQVIFNDGGAFGADNLFIWDKTNNRLGVGETSPQSSIHITGTSPRLLLFDNDFVISATNPAWSTRSADGIYAIQRTVDYSSYTDQIRVTPSTVAVSSLANITANSNFRVNVANVALSFAVGQFGVGDVMIQGYNNGINSTTTLQINPLGGAVSFGGTPYFPALTNDNTETSVLVRQSDGEIQTRAVSTIALQDGDKGHITVSSGGTVWSIDSDVLSKGTYTPTLTNISNIDSSTAYVTRYERIFDRITVSGRISVDATAIGQIAIEIDLPIASDLADIVDLTGLCVEDGAASQPAGIIFANTGTNRAYLELVMSSASGRDIFFTFSYIIK